MTHRNTVTMIAAGVLLAGCAGTGPSVVGTTTGAAVTSAPEVSSAAGRAADDPHCAASGHVVPVRDARSLRAALLTARPGHVIELADGRYEGQFTATGPATQNSPVMLRGSRSAVLDGGGRGYTLHLSDADWWTVCGIAVVGGAKGVVLDETTHASLVGLSVSGTGQEAVHLRTNSSANVVRGLTIDATGLVDPQFGEGIYVGSAEGNWCRYTDCLPDESNGNQIVGNAFGPSITAENIDVKEGTRGGVIEANRFDGRGATAADSWVDVKGNDWQVRGNRGAHAPVDGMQVHVISTGWGQGNVFESNDLTVDAAGYGIKVDARAVGTVVGCDNRVVGAGSGPSNVSCVGGP